MAMIVTAEQPALCLRDLEDRVAHGNAQIGTLDQHEPTAHGVAVDGGDDGLLQCARHERIFDSRPPAAGRAMLQRFLHVLAGAERPASASEDRDFELAVAAELGPGLGEPRAHFMTERIEALGPPSIDKDLPVTLGFNDCHFRLSSIRRTPEPISYERAARRDCRRWPSGSPS